MALFTIKKDESAAALSQQGMPPLPNQSFQPQMQQQGYPQQGYNQQGYQGYDQQGYAQPQQMPSPPMREEPIDKEKIEEIAEAIIDEKWNELLKDINKMIEWKNKTENVLARMQQDIENLKTNFDSLHKGILGKISEYDKNLVEVGTEIKAMEKVFQKVLPTFTENVNKLSRITRGLPLTPIKK
ncbi:MAG: hypothetical protein ABIJ08_03145 [Nanoarchaeota archaeon]